MPDNEIPIKFTGDASKLTDATDAAKEQLKNAGESVKMLGDLIGITIPDAIKDMLASSELIGPALDAAFAPLAIISLGMAIYDATEKAKQHEEELKKLADEALNSAGSNQSIWRAAQDQQSSAARPESYVTGQACPKWCENCAG